MNKKIIPLLLVLPLLGGCNNVSKPSFKNVGKKVSVETYMEEIAKRTEKNIFTKEYEEGTYKPSFKGSLSTKGSSKEVTKRNKKEIGSREDSSVINIDLSLDTKNGASKRKQKTVVTEKIKSKSTTNVGSDKTVATYIVQKVTDGDKVYASTVNTKEKYYTVSPSNQVTESTSFEYLLDLSGNILFSIAVPLYQSLVQKYYQAVEAKDTEEAGRYSFYQHKSVFTVEYNLEKSDEEAKTSTKTLYRIQTDLTKDTKIAYTFYKEETVKSEALQDDEGTLKGDITEKTTKGSLVVKASKSNVTVKPVKLNGYSKYVSKYDL